MRPVPPTPSQGGSSANACARVIDHDAHFGRWPPVRRQRHQLATHRHGAARRRWYGRDHRLMHRSTQRHSRPWQNTEEIIMNKRPLGRSGLDIAPLVFGGNVFGWTADEATSFKLLDRFVERGFNAIDTADVYASWAPGLGGGESETVIGNWLAKRGRRDDLVIMTKVAKWAQRPGLSAANIQAAVEDSLRRLRS